MKSLHQVVFEERDCPMLSKTIDFLEQIRKKLNEQEAKFNFEQIADDISNFSNSFELNDGIFDETDH